MKLKNPRSQSDLSIKKNYHVLEVGPGNYPHKRSNVLVERFIDINYHRSGDLKVLGNQTLIEADGHALPFKEKEFDYVICSHVLEHVDDPAKFLAEQFRVAPRGYLETPSIIGEYLMPKESHKWVLQEIDNKIVMYEKDKINFHTSPDLGYIFLNYLPKNSIGFKIMDITHANLTRVNYEWENEIEVLINPDSDYYKQFFTQPLNEKLCKILYPEKKLSTELLDAGKAFGSVILSVINSRLLKQ
ncbi:class I SAM-dependent methyltransferase [Mucilaginibacter gilvus]|uniref:Class I SAM-dependent methyltransferase n=1 Tax=Mucilaginibacter gilvus TaxID=2305909 RepID=A0A444MJA6_9SPHI|nr:class I SAM-dependent methyltransferase [Mucilaginibacter gilvus]RWY48160.1 class I SAM-dependent methyltransferase [Mucilaginibacter gilvus]